MYQEILVALDNSPTDQAVLPHITELAKVHGSELLLIHVADGWAARNYNRFQLADSEEMKDDRVYLETTASELRRPGARSEDSAWPRESADRDPQGAEESACNLIAMTTHGHRFLKDLIYGNTITQVRHRAKVPVLLVNAAIFASR